MATKKSPVKVLKTSQRLIIFALIIALFYILFYSFKSIRNVFYPAKPTHIQSISVEKGKLGLKYPQGIAVNTQKDWLYVTSTMNSRVFVFDENFKEIFNFGEKHLKAPVFIATNKEGTKVYVTDRGQKAVFVFSSDGNFISKLKLKELNNPLAIAIDKEDNIYLSDTGKEHQILKYDSSGNPLLKFGFKQRAVPETNAKGAFYFPNSIVIDKNSNIYVSDSNNRRIQIFDKNGDFKNLIVTGGLPRGIALNEKAHILFVVDTLKHKINTYNTRSFKYISSFSQLGSSDADVAFPNGIALKGKDLEQILVVDRENGRVQLYKTKLTIRDVIRKIRPYRPLIPLPFLGLLLLLLLSRRKKYILSDCFIDTVVTKHKLEDLLKATRLYHTTPTLFKRITGDDFLVVLENKINQATRFSYPFVEKIKEEKGLSDSQAEILALAHHKGIYQPVILACNKKLLEAAKDLGIATQTPESFFKTKNKK